MTRKSKHYSLSEEAIDMLAILADADRLPGREANASGVLETLIRAEVDRREALAMPAEGAAARLVKGGGGRTARGGRMGG